MSKFKLGKLPIKPSIAKFVGQITDREGYDRVVIPALFAKDDNHAFEYGEVVEIVGDLRTNYTVQAITDSTAVDANLGVILYQRDGKVDIKGGLLTKPEDNVTLSVWVLRENRGTVAVPVLGGDTLVKAGGTIHLGTGLNGTVAGAVYGEAVTSDGTIAITGLKFRDVAHFPTTSTEVATAPIGL